MTESPLSWSESYYVTDLLSSSAHLNAITARLDRIPPVRSVSCPGAAPAEAARPPAMIKPHGRPHVGACSRNEGLSFGLSSWRPQRAAIFVRAHHASSPPRHEAPFQLGILSRRAQRAYEEQLIRFTPSRLALLSAPAADVFCCRFGRSPITLARNRSSTGFQYRSVTV